ncbi:MAG: CAP domain-containing protein [Lacunisphaera sp.]|nr:CAP domain-containing protein [Lacunisphaera sp.]
MLTGCVRVVPPPAISLPAPDNPAVLEARMEAANFDRELLARAIFRETNRVRAQLGLKPFGYLPKLNEAADLEAAVGKVYQPPSHTNSFPMIGTPMQRVLYVGLDPGLVAENIALLPIYEVEVKLGAGVVMRDGKKHFVNPGTQEDLRLATYQGFAVQVVDAWMNSPGHRVNIVHTDLRYLGCSVLQTVSILGVDQLFCVQVFFTPKK